MPRVLLVDDDETLRTMLHAFLERWGYEVETAATGNEAIAACKRQAPDLVITDLVMPDKEGLETILEIRQKWPQLKMIAMSGGGPMGVTQLLKMAKQFGAAQTLSKPFTPDDFRKAVTAVLPLESAPA